MQTTDIFACEPKLYLKKMCVCGGGGRGNISAIAWEDFLIWKWRKTEKERKKNEEERKKMKKEKKIS